MEYPKQHPIGIYLKIWALLFILSGLSYSVDYFHFEGYLRWVLDYRFHDVESRFNCCILHAYGLGAGGLNLCRSYSTTITVNSGWHWCA